MTIEPAARLLLIRHAHADADGRLCGHFDAPLSGRGRAQLRALRALGTRLPAPAALYTSTLTRAREVAAVLEDLWKLHASEVEAAREIHCGALDGMRLDELQRDFPHLWNLNRAQVDSDFAWPGGESYACFRRRVLAALAGIAAKHPGQRVAVVTHAGVISQVLGSVRGRPPGVWEVDRPDPLTATEVTWDGAPLSLVRYNDSHWY